MTNCRDCERPLPLESSGRCEYCEEIHHEKFAEKYLERDEIVCQHCGGRFTPGAFDAHKWRVYYRTHDFPSGARRRTR